MGDYITLSTIYPSSQLLDPCCHVVILLPVGIFLFKKCQSWPLTWLWSMECNCILPKLCKDVTKKKTPD